MPNSFCHVELTTGDPEKAKDFYGKLFSWKYEEAPMEGGGTYTMIQPGVEPGGGIMKAPENVPTGWTVYVLVEGIDGYVSKVGELGGTVIHPATPIPNYGKFAVIQDPTGGVIGLWEALKK